MNTKSANLLPCTLAAGLAGLALRLILYRTGFDEKGLLAGGHPLHLFSVVLAAAAIVYLALRCRKITGSTDPRVNFPPTVLSSAAGLTAGILMLLHTCVLARGDMSPLALIRLVLSALCTASMLLVQCPPIQRSAMHLICHSAICIHFALDILCRYQDWSGNPQLPDYCFHVLACVFLCLCSYHRLAFHVGQGSRKMLSFCCLTALLLCMLSMVGPEPMVYYLGGACWAVSCMCTLTAPADPTPAEAEGAEVTAETEDR